MLSARLFSLTPEQLVEIKREKAKRGYKEEREGDTIFFINTNTSEKWEESRTPDGTLFYASLKSRQSVWELPESDKNDLDQCSDHFSDGFSDGFSDDSGDSYCDESDDDKVMVTYKSDSGDSNVSNDKWKNLRTMTIGRVQTLTIKKTSPTQAPLSTQVSASLPRGQSIEQKKNNFGGRSKSMTNYGSRVERKSGDSQTELNTISEHPTHSTQRRQTEPWTVLERQSAKTDLWLDIHPDQPSSSQFEHQDMEIRSEIKKNKRKIKTKSKKGARPKITVMTHDSVESMILFSEKSQSSESIPKHTSLEGMVKIKILCHPKQLKAESKPSWKEFYSLLEYNNLLFYPNQKSCHKDGKLKEAKLSQSVSESVSRDKYSSACELNTTVTLVIEEDKRKKKVLKINKSNGLEMLFQPIQSTPTIEEWAEGIRSYIVIERKSSISSPVDPPVTPVVVKEYTPPQTVNGEGCDYDSILAEQAITKKTINNFLKNRPDKDSHKIQELLAKTGIGNLNNLDKDIRKKILKEFLGKRPTYEELKKKGLIKDTVFNCTLDKLCFREQCFVPKFIRQCVRAIEAKGLTSAGLYRIAGNHAAITKLRHRVDQDEPVDLMSAQYQDINLLAGCFKLFLRELPEPVIPWSDFDPISGIMRSAGSDDKKVKGLTVTIGRMGEPNASVLHFIMSHLVRVASLSERNQMNPHNLSIIFGPSLLGAPPEKANLFQDLPVQNAAIELMITHFHQVFDRTFKYQNQPMLE